MQLERDTGLKPSEISLSKASSTQQFQKQVLALRRKLVDSRPGMISARERNYMLYDIKQEPGSDTGKAVVGDPVTARVFVVDFGPDHMSLLPPDEPRVAKSVVFLPPPGRADRDS